MCRNTQERSQLFGDASDASDASKLIGSTGLRAGSAFELHR
jgi:hypothetical protein